MLKISDTARYPNSKQITRTKTILSLNLVQCLCIILTGVKVFLIIV